MSDVPDFAGCVEASLPDSGQAVDQHPGPVWQSGPSQPRGGGRAGLVLVGNRRSQGRTHEAVRTLRTWRRQRLMGQRKATHSAEAVAIRVFVSASATDHDASIC